MNNSLKSIKDELKNYRNNIVVYSTKNTPQLNSQISNRHSIIIQAINTLRLIPKQGETYYKIIYYNYLSPEVYYNTYEIIEALEIDGIFLSLRTYYRYKSKALYWLTEIINAANNNNL